MDALSYLLGKNAGGGGGTSNYADLTNKPSINSVELIGNKTLEDLGISIVDVLTSNSAQNPFIFDGKKEGLYIFKSSADSSFYYKFKSTESSYRSYSNNSPIWVYLKKDIVYDDLTANENFGFLMSLDYRSGSVILNGIYKSTALPFNYGTSKYIAITSQPQTFYGIKTFEAIPKQGNTNAPTLDEQFTNKKYVDDQINNAIGNINTILATLTTPSNNGGGN